MNLKLLSFLTSPKTGKTIIKTIDKNCAKTAKTYIDAISPADFQSLPRTNENKSSPKK